jgi:HD-like signal output (HDOD) protein
LSISVTSTPLENSLTTNQLKKLNPLNKLDDEGLEELAKKLYIETIVANRNLFVRGQNDNWHYYLLDGSLSFTAPQQEAQQISSEDKKSILPLSPHLPRRVTATALIDSSFIRIDRDLLELLLSKDKLPIYTVEELTDGATDLQHKVLYRILHDYITDRLVIPSMPELAIRITRAADDPDMDVVKLTRLLQFDPAVTARIIQAANSPIYRTENEITTIRHAVEHLGFDITRQLAVGFTLQQLYNSPSKLFRHYIHDLWKANSRIAALSFIIAPYAKGVHQERAFLAGLLCRIGALPVIQHAEIFPELQKNLPLLNTIVAKLTPIVGSMILRKWGFTDEIVNVALESTTWQRDPKRHPDYTDVVLLARLHQAIGTSSSQSLPPIDSVPAYKKIASGSLSPKGSMQIIESARDEIEELEKLLAFS